MESDLEGTWYNELNSCLTILSALDGQLTGTYESEVGNADATYVMSGRYDSSANGRTLGWTVSWYNSTNGSSESTTTWSGQYQVDTETLVPQILTSWLLTVQTTQNDNWNSTNLGFDTFTKTQPSPQVILKAKQCGRCSHPKSASSSK